MYEIIKQESSDKECYICNGYGYDNESSEDCETCDGTGVFKDNHYIIIANGIAFQMDSIK